MPVTLTIHRSASEIGGNCIELKASDGTRILLDAGRPLDAPEHVEVLSLVPSTLDTTSPLEAVLLSHPHQDHYGLLQGLPSNWRVYSGPACRDLTKFTAVMLGDDIRQPFVTWTSGQQFRVGPFSVTPFLTDHSAFDAYMLLIEVERRRILYSGDFRAHGRKATLVRRMMADPPRDLDVLLLEGTNLGSDKLCVSEKSLENRFADLFASSPGRTFVAWSAQNVDRTVTLYRACLKSGRTLVVDLYTAEVMELLAGYRQLPRPGWRNLKVVVTAGLARRYRARGRAEFVERMAKHGISARALANGAGRWVAMIRSSLIRDYAAGGVNPDADDAWSWSLWSGYLKDEGGRQLARWFEPARACHIHTSGHASVADLRMFAESIAPKAVVPIHGVAWDGHFELFPRLKRLSDGEQFAF